jgi:hypothetical protein
MNPIPRNPKESKIKAGMTLEMIIQQWARRPPAVVVGEVICEKQMGKRFEVVSVPPLTLKVKCNAKTKVSSSLFVL